MSDDDAYSATELGSHWFERPEGEPDAKPDRVDGEVLRFGPGVTAAAVGRAANTPTAAQIWHGTLPGSPPPGPVRRRRSWRYAPACAVLALVLVFLAWQHYGPGVAVREVTVTAPGRELGCDSTADVVALVRTDGRPGTVTYRWERSDGTRSAPLRERLSRGQKEAELHLMWTFHGSGTHRATARLVIESPTGHTTSAPASSGAAVSASASFTYRCG
ncbi:hypothetical protein OG361_40220 [Streptomyces sp. NBC_00090]|uniref:hypothetical protein n=1 Tax=Streptomyces sp. NBC_00090 TaxID=2903619 RepID=UPI0032446CA3